MKSTHGPELLDERVAVEQPMVTVVVPAHNEEGNIPRLREELVALLDDLPYRFEILVIDNDSTDRTGELVKAICRADSRWKYLRLSRNFGAEASISAGYIHSAGDAVIVVYSDLQEPPALIPEFLAKWEEGFDVVYGVQTARAGDSALKSWLVRRAYRMIGRLAEVRIPVDASDFRLVTREVVDALGELTERSRFLRGQIAWLGFRQVGVPYTRRPRTAGKSESSLGFLIRYLIDAITALSLRPLRLAPFVAGILSAVSLVWGITIAALSIAGHPPSSFSLLGLLIVAVGSLNAVSLWMLSEYVARIHVESRRRPVYVIAEAVNIKALRASGSRDNGMRRAARSAAHP